MKAGIYVGYDINSGDLIANTLVENLINSNRKVLEVFLDIYDDTIIGLDKDSKISFWNKDAEKKFGYKKEEIIGQSIHVLIPDDKIDEFKTKNEGIREGKIIESLETKRIHKSGEIMDISVSVVPLYDFHDNFIGAIGIYKDISERKKLIQKLHEHEERWRFALEGGIWSMGLEYKY